MLPLCRICRAELTKKVFYMPSMPLTDDFIETSRLERQEYVRDISIYNCDECGITQNPEDFNHEAYYQDYRYTSGHSEFTNKFMDAYANEILKWFIVVNGRQADSVVEVGSGDGQQLSFFKSLGVNKVLGIEPSNYLATISRQRGFETKNILFSRDAAQDFQLQIDVCLSSYTFDHVRQPLDYLAAAYDILGDGGILALEIHDLGKIIDRSEFCLFEHEHTIYLDSEAVTHLLEQNGFAVLSINPIPNSLTRGNSLIVIARKGLKSKGGCQRSVTQRVSDLEVLQSRVDSTIGQIDYWIDSLPPSSRLVGYGAGGRGVMTLAGISKFSKFVALFDSAYQSGKYFTPRTRIPVYGKESLFDFRDSYCLIFSYGYYDEILESLRQVGFDPERVVSLLDFYSRKL